MTITSTAPPQSGRATVAAVVAHVEHFRGRVLQDALAEASSAYWHRRAAAFDAARPRPGDYVGQATRSDLAARDRDGSAIAQACRARAAVSILAPEVVDRPW